VKLPIGGKVRERKQDLVKFQNRQYSLDGRRANIKMAIYFFSIAPFYSNISMPFWHTINSFSWIYGASFAVTKCLICPV
jgi:hypothetical protein